MPDTGGSLLDLLREDLGIRSVKDGCSPQGQCGCCTVLVDGQPRAACVTAARRVAGRRVDTVAGLDPGLRDRWAQAFLDHGASQCGFCTPGILLRLVGMTAGRVVDRALVERALAAHVCRCTGWRTIVDAALAAVDGEASPAGSRAAAGVSATQPPAEPAPGPPAPTVTVPTVTVPTARCPRDAEAAARRATVEGGVAQRVGTDVVLGDGGFADDTAPRDCLVAVPDGEGGWTLGETLAEARRRAGRTPGRNSTLPLRHPVEPPPGRWAVVLRTTFVEPAYLELDASWCRPGEEPASPLANGGAFGGKLASVAPATARRLADETGRPVRVVLAREDVVRLGPKRPPVAAGVRADGSGLVRVARTPGADLTGWAAALQAAAPGLAVEEVAVKGPPVSASLRGAGWAEGAVLQAAASWVAAGGWGPGADGVTATMPVGTGVTATVGPGGVTITTPVGASATATVGPDGGTVEVVVEAGEVLDEVVLRSYAVGAAHQALGWVRSEGVAVDEDGTVHDLTIRSFGILGARATPEMAVTVRPAPGPPVPGGDAVFAAVAAAAWIGAGLPDRWPVARQ